MRYKVVISIEQIQCHRVSSTALKESQAEVHTDGKQLSPPTDCLRLMLYGLNASYTIAVQEMGTYRENDALREPQVVYSDDAETWPVLNLTFAQVPPTDGRTITLGEILFHYEGNGFFSWQAGKNTTYTREEVRPGLWHFEFSGDGSRYITRIRAVVLDTGFERFLKSAPG
jgi:hypothetical protein